ncbi:unnamed protein product [Lepidochelys kempii]
MDGPMEGGWTDRWRRGGGRTDGGMDGQAGSGRDGGWTDRRRDGQTDGGEGLDGQTEGWTDRLAAGSSPPSELRRPLLPPLPRELCPIPGEPWVKSRGPAARPAAEQSGTPGRFSPARSRRLLSAPGSFPPAAGTNTMLSGQARFARCGFQRGAPRLRPPPGRWTAGGAPGTGPAARCRAARPSGFAAGGWAITAFAMPGHRLQPTPGRPREGRPASHSPVPPAGLPATGTPAALHPARGAAPRAGAGLFMLISRPFLLGGF